MAEEKRQNESEFQFVQEKIKQPAPRKSKILRKAVLTILFGVVFGVVACITFVLLYPWAQERFGEEPVKEVNIPRDEDMESDESEQKALEDIQKPDDDQKEQQEELVNAPSLEQPGENSDAQTIDGQSGEKEDESQQEGSGSQESDGQNESNSQQETDETSSPDEPHQPTETVPQDPVIITQTIPLELPDYTKLFEKMRSIGKEAAKSMVTVTVERSGTDWFQALQENERQVSGMLVGDNGVEKLILTNYSDIEDAKELYVTFSDYSGAPAVLKKYDRITDLAVLGVNLADMSEITRNQVKTVAWGNSKTVKAGEPVIAVGNPVGIPGSMLFGNITAITYDVPVVDGEYQLLLTDMARGTYSNGALVNFNGEIVGWIQDSYLHAGNRDAMTAYGISGLKSIIEHLCNNQDIVYLGVTCMDMDDKMQEILSFPTGVYIASVEMDSPAMTAGLQSGDIIVDISGQRIGKISEMQELMLNFSAEQIINIKVLRQGKEGLKEIAFDVALTALK